MSTSSIGVLGERCSVAGGAVQVGFGSSASSYQRGYLRSSFVEYSQLQNEDNQWDAGAQLTHINFTSNSVATSDTRVATSCIKLFLSGEALTVGIGAPLS